MKPSSSSRRGAPATNAAAAPRIGLPFSLPALIAFLVTALGLVSVAGLGLAVLGASREDPVFGLLYAVGLLSPFLAALVYIQRTQGGLGPVLGLYRVRGRDASWLSLGVLPVAIALPYLVSSALGLPLDLSATGGAGPLLLGILLWTSVMWAEETGWRGVLQPVLQERVGPLSATLLVALVWSAWHLPLLALFGYGWVEWGFFLLQMFGLSAVMTWARNRSGTVVLPIVLHGVTNGTMLWLAAAVPTADVTELLPLQATGPFILGLTLILATRGRLGLDPSPASAPHPWRSRFQRSLAAAPAVFFAIATMSNVAAKTGHEAMKAAAVQIDVGDRHLAMVCSGSGARTYVLEAGAMGFSGTWAWLQDLLDDSARVCSYDRAGLGLSDPKPGGFSADGVVRDLALALDSAGIPGPVVLVGHSLGGIFVRDFALTHPERVEALVLLDSSHEDQLSLLDPEEVASTRDSGAMLRRLGHLSRTGATRLFNPLLTMARGLPDTAFAHAELYSRSPSHLNAAAAEIEAWESIMDRVRRKPHSSTLPILAVSAGTAAPGLEGFVDAVTDLRAELARGSTLGQHQIVAAADHYSLIMHEAHAQVVAELITRFMESMDSSGRAPMQNLGAVRHAGIPGHR